MAPLCTTTKENALNDNESTNLLSSTIEENNKKEKKPRDDNDLRKIKDLAHYHLLRPKKNQHKTMTSISTHHRFLQPKKKN